jgi:sec-independent protein translocase protein TatB
MFNVGGGELLVILLIALMVLGPDRLPGFAKKAGKVMGDVRRISQGFQSEIRDAIDFSEDDAPSKPADEPSSTTPTTPRLVEPPKPVQPALEAASDDDGTAEPAPAVTDSNRPNGARPDAHGDESASDTSAA